MAVTEKKIDTSDILECKNGKLIPLKGVDDTRKKVLNQLGIENTSDLLSAGRTDSKRQSIAVKILKNEKPDLKETDPDYPKWKTRFTNYVESWVKQADLWRVEGMDSDTAYLLVELGVRFVEDLPKIDPEKVYPMMKALAQTQADFSVISMESLQEILGNSEKVSVRYPALHRKLSNKIKALLAEGMGLKPLKLSRVDQTMPGLSLNVTQESNLVLTDSTYEKLIAQIEKLNYDRVLDGSVLEFDDEAPEYLFKEDAIEKNESICSPEKNYEIIKKGLAYLNEIEPVLSLPSRISGVIYLKSSSEKLPEDEEARQGYALYDAKVEISGISSPTEDKGEEHQNPYCYVDSSGKFEIKIPGKYSIEEKLTLTVSKDGCSQNIMITAEELLSHVREQKVLAGFSRLDLLTKDRGLDMEAVSRVDEEISLTQPNEERYQKLVEEKNRLNKDIEGSLEKEKELKDFICASDTSTTDLERILRNLLNKNNLCADFTEEPFVLIKEVFEKDEGFGKRVLPSVKLMEKDHSPVYLPTDTAPSKIYNYSMLQRLVEPEISANGKAAARGILGEAIDVMKFKDTIRSNPQAIKHMSSLGIGYILNMHQAWVPDGFALGNLLYSLVLAPGEEQRLVVRENKQSYTITDTAEAQDSVNESYSLSQMDNTDAAYQYALNQLMQANSHYDYEAKTTSVGGSFGIGGLYSGFAAALGLNAGYTKSTASANSSASQSNSHNEASSAAQRFQHSIKSASEKISAAQRVSMSIATSSETDSVATRIIANHNHSHTMTIQYWEVMRRYKMETCIDGVELVLFVPVKLINFLNGQEYSLKNITSIGTVSGFKNRYSILANYADVLKSALPNKYRSGIELIRKFSAMPNWTSNLTAAPARTMTFELQGNFLSIDNISATMILKNGKANIAAEVDMGYKDAAIADNAHKTSAKLKEAIRDYRNKPHTRDTSKCICTFTVPADVTDEEISRILIQYSCDELNYVLRKDPTDLAADGDSAQKIIEDLWHYQWDYAKDFNNEAGDIKRIEYQKQVLPEAWITPNVRLSASQVRQLGVPEILSCSFKSNTNSQLTGTPSSRSLQYNVYVNISGATPTLTMKDVEETESTLQYIASNAMTYSQVIWAALTSDERAMLLEGYTIDMNYEQVSEEAEKNINIPLLNCIDVRNLLGFYGNCMLFPFTYPQELAEKIKKTAGELQDALYRYHTNYFRVPKTVISLPTEGMIGEAVLGETNVSEEIDLTRFWNWQDSPIDKMEIDSSYLNGTDYLANKLTKEIAALNLSGATAATPVEVSDVIKALVDKQTPAFNDITGLEQLKEVLNTATNTAATGRDKVVESSTDIAKSVMNYALEFEKAEQAAKAAEEAKKKEEETKKKSEEEKKNKAEQDKKAKEEEEKKKKEWEALLKTVQDMQKQMEALAATLKSAADDQETS